MNTNRKIAIAGLSLFLSACSFNDVGLGNAVRANNAAQLVEPDPSYKTAPVGDGAQAAAAQERYRKGTVKTPVGAKTTSGTSATNPSGSDG